MTIATVAMPPKADDLSKFIAEAHAYQARIEETAAKGGAFRRSAMSMDRTLYHRIQDRYVATFPDNPQKYATAAWMLDRLAEAAR